MKIEQAKISIRNDNVEEWEGTLLGSEVRTRLPLGSCRVWISLEIEQFFPLATSASLAAAAQGENNYAW